MTETAASAPAPATALHVATVMALLLLLAAFVSILWTPYPVGTLDVTAALQPPDGLHWLGTDPMGRDVTSMLMKGLLTSFVVAAVATAVGALIGVPLGLVASLAGGWTDPLFDGIAGWLAMLPALVVAVLLACLFGPSPATVMVAIGVAGIAPMALATRDAIRRASAHDYVAAARLAGASGLDLARRHTLPAILRIVVAELVGQLAIGVLAEATLSFIGLGTQAPASSLGLLLAEAQSAAMAQPALLIAPGVVLLVVAVTLNVIRRELREREPDAHRAEP